MKKGLFLTEDTDQITDQISNPAFAAVEPDLTAGMLIRRAREASGLHIAALAVSLKVPVKKLEALEANRFELLPDAVFVRALAGSVCRTLKIDFGFCQVNLLFSLAIESSTGE